MRGLRFVLVVVLVMSLFSGSLAGAQQTACDFVGMVNGWARATVPGAPNGAAFGILANLSAEADMLVAASSDVAEAVELHEMVMGEGDVMQMRPLADGIPVAAGGYTQLQPGGLHIMLIGLNEPLVAGETLDITLTFAAHGEIQLALPIVDDTAEPMMGMEPMATAEMMQQDAEPAAAMPPDWLDSLPEGCAGVYLLDGWARMAMPGMPNSAGYGLALNLTDSPQTIAGGATEAATALELHEMVMGEGDVMRMRPIEGGIVVLPGEAALLRPGGLHIMLIGLTGALEPGDTVDLTLDVEPVGALELALPVRDPDAEAPMQMGQ